MVIEIAKHINQIRSLCEKHKVKSLSIIDSGKQQSLVDKNRVNFLISFEESISTLAYADNYCALLDSFKTLLNKNVELVFEKSIAKPQDLKEVSRKKRLLFEA